jgi:hypothetical protein
LCQFGEMGSWPIDSPALRADSIVIIVLQRSRFCGQASGHILLACGLEQSVTFEAARERSNRAGGYRESEPTQDLSRLHLRIVGPWAEPVFDNRVHEQTAIACEDCSILGGHDLEKAMIVGLRFVGAIQSEESEVAGKPTEMSIDDKAFATPPLQARL